MSNINRTKRTNTKTTKTTKRNTPAVINSEKEKKTDNKKETALERGLEFILYVLFIFGLEISKSVLTTLISSGECSITGVTIAVAVVAVIFALLKEKIKEALSEVIKKALASKKKIKRKRVRN